MYATDYTYYTTIHNARCIADATDRKSAAAGAQFTTQRRRRGHFRKLALSTDKFILNVISRR